MTRAADGLDHGHIPALLSPFRGEVIVPGDAGYEDARRVWNASVDRRPAMVLRCTSVDDVATAVAAAQELALPLAVRGGGHNVAGLGTCEGGVVVDLSPMNAVHVDGERRIAYVGPGAVWGDFDRATQRLGLASTGGVVSSTGVAGLTLGGGIGWLQRRLGLACDGLRAATLVLADGTRVRASPDENAELLWGLRGGGGNFGVVTAFEFDLHAVGPVVYGGLFVWRADEAARVLALFREFSAEAPDDVMLIAILRTAPPAPFLPTELHGTPIAAIAVCCSRPPEVAERVLAPLRVAGNPVVDAVRPREYGELNAMFDASWTPGFQNYWKAEYLAALPDECIDLLADAALRHTSPLSDIKIAQLGGAVARVGEDDTAYGHRRAPFIVTMNTRWTDAREAPRHEEHTRALWRAVAPFSDGGAYVNFLDDDEGPERVRAAYGAATFRRLQGLKRVCDPENVFRLNQNIPPA